MASNWSTWALAIYIPNTGIDDPILNTDIGFTLGRFNALILFLILLLIYIGNTLLNSYFMYLIRRPNLSNWSVKALNSKQKKYKTK